MVDNHIHSDFSPDSNMSIDFICNRGIELGYSAIAITDHMDHDFLDGSYSFEPHAYHDAMVLAKERFKGKINLIIGVEEGYQPHVLDEVISDFEIIKPDFIICTNHSVDEIDLSLPDFFIGKNREQAFTRYLETIEEGIQKMPSFDTVAHIGYIRRYAPYGENSLTYAEFKDYFDAIFKGLIEKGKAMEINTSGLFRYGFLMPETDIIKAYIQMGGELITLGSDAHYPKAIGYQFDAVVDILKELGLRYLTHFIERKPVFEKI
ncbi:MAG: histidinol-phosphatase HisJ family protein [Clostridia bacterium]